MFGFYIKRIFFLQLFFHIWNNRVSDIFLRSLPLYDVSVRLKWNGDWKGLTKVKSWLIDAICSLVTLCNFQWFFSMSFDETCGKFSLKNLKKRFKGIWSGWSTSKDRLPIHPLSAILMSSNGKRAFAHDSTTRKICSTIISLSWNCQLNIHRKKLETCQIIARNVSTFKYKHRFKKDYWITTWLSYKAYLVINWVA